MTRAAAATRRHAVTRILCLLVLMGNALLILSWFGVVVMIVLAAAGRVATPPWALAHLAFAGVALVVLFGLSLLAWRACDACRYRLYNFLDGRWLWVSEVSRLHEAPRAPHPRTVRFLGSIGYGTIWSKAVRGVAHCPWCGHGDGEATSP